MDTIANFNEAMVDGELVSLNIDQPPAITPRATRAQRQFAHKAAMEGRKYDRARLGSTTTPLRTRADLRKRVGIGSIAEANRHTGKPHLHARERRRDFVANVRGAVERLDAAQELATF